MAVDVFEKQGVVGTLPQRLGLGRRPRSDGCRGVIPKWARVLAPSGLSEFAETARCRPPRGIDVKAGSEKVGHSPIGDHSEVGFRSGDAREGLSGRTGPKGSVPCGCVVRRRAEREDVVIIATGSGLKATDRIGAYFTHADGNQGARDADDAQGLTPDSPASVHRSSRPAIVEPSAPNGDPAS